MSWLGHARATKYTSGRLEAKGWADDVKKIDNGQLQIDNCNLKEGMALDRGKLGWIAAIAGIMALCALFLKEHARPGDLVWGSGAAEVNCARD